MSKELYLYTGIYNFSAESFMRELDEIPKDEPVSIRVNSPGGFPISAWGMIAKINERSGNVKMKIDGAAYSTAFYMALLVDDVECLDVSKFLIHRADGLVQSEQDKQYLASINKDLRATVERRVKAEKFLEVTGVSLDDIFDPMKRLDVFITPEQMQAMGVVKKIIPLTAQIQEEIEAAAYKFAANYVEKYKASSEKNNNVNQKKMNKSEFIAQHPELYASIVAEVKGLEQERVKAYLAYIDVDKDNVITAIKEGKEFTMSVGAEMQMKVISATKTTEIVNKTTATTTATTEVKAEKTDAEKEVEAFQANFQQGLKSKFGLKK